MRSLVVGSLFLASVFGVGCGSDPGAINVQWDIGLSGNCADEGITTVRITLTEEGGATVGPFEAPCGSGADGFSIDDIPEGSYSIDLEGYNSDGDLVYTGHSTGRTKVSEGKTAAPNAIVMSPAPARITVRWAFEDPRGCRVQAGEPDTVQVLLFKGNREETTEETDCEDFELVIDDLDANDDYDIRVTALNGSTKLFAFEQSDLALADGEQAVVDGVLLPCADVPNLCN